MATVIPTTLNSVKDYALFYLKELGFSVFPLKNPDFGDEKKLKERKEPDVVSLEPFKNGLATEHEVIEWCDKNPNLNIGFFCGNVSMCLVFDADSKAAVDRIESAILEMSPNLRIAVQNTMIVETGGGGKHYIFKISEQTDIGRKVIWRNNDKNVKHSQIEVRGNDHYVVTAPSRHPNGNLYKWNHRTPELLTDKQVEELSLLVSNSDKSGIQLKNKIHATTITPTTSATVVSKETLQMLLELIKPYYTAGSRNDIIYYLSGFMRKDGGFSLADTKEFVTLLCNWSKTSKYSDEDLEKSLQVVENTYSKPMEELNGKSGLHELLVTTYESASSEEYQNGANTYKQIRDIIVAVKNKGKEGKKNKPIRYLYSSRPKAWVELRNGEIIDEETGEMRQVRRLQEFKHIPEFDRATKQWITKVVYGNVILAAVPVLSGQHEDGDDGVGIHIVYDPLFKTEKYKMAFEYVDKQQDSGIRRTEVIGPVTITGLRR
ncbi:MAG: bifunctional DNA primase/polymerase, partial [Nitrososphaeraceae archaeon]